MVRTTQHLFNDASSVDLLLLMAFICRSYFNHQPQVTNQNIDKVGDNKNAPRSQSQNWINDSNEHLKAAELVMVVSNESLGR